MGLHPVKDATRPALALLPAAHDLPVSWDGRHVEWGPWHVSTQPTHLPEDVCQKCGALGPQQHALGTRDPIPGATEIVDVIKRTRSGREYGITEERPARAILELMARRCTSCAADTVHDLATDELWTLGPEDYGDAGSISDGALW